MSEIARLRVTFHIPGKYVMETIRDDDGSEADYPRWIPGVDHAAGKWFKVSRFGKACGIYGIEDGIPVAMCYRELRPATDEMIGEAEILVIPTILLEVKRAEEERHE